MSDSPSSRSFFHSLRERKVFGTAVAYLVIGFGLVEASALLFPRLQFPSQAVDVLIAVLLFGFPLALAVAWRLRGRDPAASVSPVLSIVSLAFVAVAFWWLGFRALPSAAEPETAAEDVTRSLPLVIMMDSPHPDRVYDEETLAANGTNADVISDILLDLPIRRQRETIGPEWHRDEEILQFDPDLVVIHYSGFRQGLSDGPRDRLKMFMSFFVESETRFILYSRQSEAGIRTGVDELLSDLDEEHPGFLSRVDVFGLPDHGPPKWRSPLTANALKLRVKEILDI
jgi:hypothetical protein